MSRQYEYERTTRRTTTSLSRSGLSGLRHWVPLGLTVLVATVGIAAWIWSERQDDEDDIDGTDGAIISSDSVYPRDRDPSRNATIDDSVPFDGGAGYLARMSGALKRTPSPQQFLDGASRNIVAGVAAAGAVVGSALTSIREEDKHAYKDHKTWSEEADIRTADAGPVETSISTYSGRRKTVAVVVSATSTGSEGVSEDGDYHHEHTSLLSHLPAIIDHRRIRLFILIYVPELQEHPLDSQARKSAGSLSSSFSNIMPPDDETDRHLSSLMSTSSTFNAMWSQAQTLVEKETMVLPFTTSTGHIHMLRHLNPEYVYLQESLSGHMGESIIKMQSWLRQDIVLVVGAEGDHGGLADSESDNEKLHSSRHWWEQEDRVGRGRGVVVVEGLRLGEDWGRRIDGNE